MLEFVQVLAGSTSSEKLLSHPLSVKGCYKDRKIELSEPVNKQDGQTVIVTFLEGSEEKAALIDAAWDELDNILKDCQMSTGISDLVYQHDHYLIIPYSTQAIHLEQINEGNMKAMLINEFGDSSVFVQSDLPRPAVKKGHVLIRVEASSVNPVCGPCRTSVCQMARRTGNSNSLNA